MSNELSTQIEPTMSLARFLPQTLEQLVRFAETVSGSGLFGQISKQQATVLMMYGAELGVNPLAAMREIYLIEGRNGRMQMLPSAALTSARIQQSGDLEQWETETSDKRCTITFKRKGRSPQSVSVGIEDIPARYFAKTRSGQDSQWTTIPEDMLYAWTVRRVARRHFADKLIAIQPEDEWVDETRVIDVAKVERAMPDGEKSWPCTACRSGRMYLHSNPNGGVYLRCADCNATDVPPPEVRDLVRGTPEALTIAAPPEDPEAPLPDGDSSDTEPAPDAPEDAAENGAGSPPPEPTPVEAYDDPALVDAGSGDAQTGAIPPEPVAEATMEPSPSEAATPRAASPSPREQVRAFLRANRTATGQRHIAIRDALLDAGWDGTSGITATVAGLSEEAITKLLGTFAAPSFGTVE